MFFYSKSSKVKQEEEKSSTSDEANEDPMISGIRDELGDMELRIRNGGLGGVDDYMTWSTRLTTSQEITDFVSVWHVLFESVSCCVVCVL